jgi:prophage antirepressor-like protein
MSSLALSFNEVNFTPVQQNGQIWLTAGELARALGYAKANAVTQVYERNQDEFSSNMTQVIDNPQSLNLRLRIFSLRGAHLIAIFSKTDIAKQFRKWVLDILDREVGQPVAKTHKSERTPLHDAHAMLVAKTKHLNSSDAWKIINQRFGTKSIDEIPYEAIPVAVEYVHHLIALYSNAEKKQFSHADLQNMHALATHMIWARSWWAEFGEVIRKLNPVIAGRVNDHFIDGSSVAWQFVRADEKQELKECVKTFDWFTATYQQKLPI